jgi:hypothetical protein
VFGNLVCFSCFLPGQLVVFCSQGDFDPAYPLMFTICAFIDLLAQCRFGLEWHSQRADYLFGVLGATEGLAEGRLKRAAMYFTRGFGVQCYTTGIWLHFAA